MIGQMRASVQAHNVEEAALIEDGIALLDTFLSHEGKATDVRLARTVDKSRIKSCKGQLVGETELVMRGATPEDIIAYLMDVNSKHETSRRDPEEDVCDEVREVKSLHHSVEYYECKAPGFQNRTMLHALLWKRLSETQYLWVTVPIASHPSVGPSDERGKVRAEVKRCFRLTSLTTDSTKVEYACSLDMKGAFPRSLTEHVIVPALMRFPCAIMEYFQKLKPSCKCTARDGVRVGHMLMDLAESANRRDRPSAVCAFVYQTAMLRECELASVDVMLSSVFDQRFELQAQPVAANDPATLTEADAATIGRGFEAIIRVGSTPFDVVDELLRNYPALGAVEQRYGWFRPMLETIAKRRAATAPLGLKLRLGIGALFSFGDMASDLTQIVQMFLSGHSGMAFALILMVGMNLAFQALIAILQTAHRGWKEVLYEVFLVLSLLKPVIDAIRVAGGAEHVDGAPFDPSNELAAAKVSELTFESIPGGLAQTIFFLNGGNWTTAALVSIGLSCLSTAFTATTLAYDVDTSAARRKKNPAFYGYMPDTAAGCVWAFALLFLYHSTQSLGKTLAMAMLAQVSFLWLVAYLVADHCVFMLYKLVRGDVIYWVPGFKLPLSVLARFVAKVVADFTGLVHCRHPLELGGIYFFVNSLTSVGSWFVAAALYSRHFSGGATSRVAASESVSEVLSAINFGTNASSDASAATAMHVNKIGDLPLYVTVVALFAGWLLAIVGLVLTIKREYLRTFVSLQTGCADAQAHFLDNEGNDAKRTEIFYHNELQWRAIRDCVRAWVRGVFTVWRALMPSWLTRDLQARIPDDFIPVELLNPHAPNAEP
jgi:hypothetical protein